jgi:hypothetical protein
LVVHDRLHAVVAGVPTDERDRPLMVPGAKPHDVTELNAS